MKQICLILFLFISSFQVGAQRLHLGIFGGLSAYNGDLTEYLFPKKVSNGVIGVTANYELRDQIMIRGGLTYTVVGGADRYNSKPDLLARNLSFETSIAELSVVGEYYFKNLYTNKFSPYVFGGLAVYKFNPYAYDASGQRVFLKPLSTEGQGIAGYPKPYSLTQAALPFGAGVKYALNNNLRIGIEMGFRKLFTDYLDDVSSLYASEADLLAAKGQQSVDMSYRGDDVQGGSFIYPAKGAQRGSSKYNDIYYFTGIHLTYRITSLSGGDPMRKNRNGCPVNIY
jgi:opacity protein-like surface antigen